jgi:hypothetical protein
MTIEALQKACIEFMVSFIARIRYREIIENKVIDARARCRECSRECIARELPVQDELNRRLQFFWTLQLVEMGIAGFEALSKKNCASLQELVVFARVYTKFSVF